MKTDLAWFEFGNVIRREVKDGVWVPLWWHQSLTPNLPRAEIGYYEDFVFLNAVIVSPEFKDEVMNRECSDFNPVNGNRSQRWDAEYIRADTVYDNGYAPVAEYAVLYQEFGRKMMPQVYLNQDVIFALGLVKEGNNWIRPDDGYETVVKESCDGTGEVFKVEIKARYLKDYLCARRKCLSICSFYERSAIFGNKPGFDWPHPGEISKQISDYCKWAGYMQPMDEDGKVFPGSVHVMTSGYKEIHPEDDVPSFNPLKESDQMYSESKVLEGKPVTRYRVVSELRRFEWMTPGKTSVVVGDDDEESLSFYADADGGMKTGDELEYPPQWLWFRNDVINRVLQYRGSNYKWYSADTGSIDINTDWRLHFGINKSGLVNVLAKDIVQLPLWQQELWKGYNVPPEGGVSEELLMSQMKCEPATSQSVEDLFFLLLKNVYDGFLDLTGKVLLRGLPPVDEMRRKVHRFIVQQDDDIFKLAKEIIKITAESFDIAVLRSLITLDDEKKKYRSIKLFQEFLGTFVRPELAYKIMTPLVHLNELRCADAHKKSSEIIEALVELGVNEDMCPLQKGVQVILKADQCLAGILQLFQLEYAKRKKSESKAGAEERA